MVLTHTRRTFQEVLRYVQSGNLSEECADYLQYKCERAINILNMSSLIYNIPVTFVNQAEEIFIMVEEALREIQQSSLSIAFHIESVFSDSPGRPAFNIPREVLDMFVENKFNISAMARMLKVGEPTVKRQLRVNGISISSQYANLSESELDTIVLSILQQFPKSGYKHMIGYLLARGYRVQEKRVRELIRRVDPEGVIERSISLNIIQRGRYFVPCPMALWHMDGHHKLVRYITPITYISSSCSSKYLNAS